MGTRARRLAATGVLFALAAVAVLSGGCSASPTSGAMGGSGAGSGDTTGNGGGGGTGGGTGASTGGGTAGSAGGATSGGDYEAGPYFVTSDAGSGETEDATKAEDGGGGEGSGEAGRGHDAEVETGTGGAIDAGGHGGDAGPVQCTGSEYGVKVVDYFTGNAVAGTSAKVDGASATLPCFTLANGVHPLQITASGYATYNGAIQVPGGAMTRTVQLFPVTASASAWLTLVNSDRLANGAGPVQIDSGLMIAGWNHVVDMGKQGYFAHFDPNGFAPTTRSLLLGSMMMSAENLAAGDKTYADAEAAFMGEKNSLPNKAPGDCTADYNAAGHYCDLITASHNWVGFGMAHVPGAPYQGLYYSQEFGDLYAYYDTTVLGSYPATNSTATIELVPASGYTFKYELVQTMPAPSPITIATLNTDPTCASMCPTNDPWYPSGSTTVPKAPTPYAPPLSASEIVFLGLATNETTFFGVSAYAAFWAGGTTMPTTYDDAASEAYLIQ